jgi:CMP-N,N'-diacetyllegionaminic acid synthase
MNVTSGGVLAIVPARSGSKGVPGKNVRPLAGRTLLDYVASAARDSGVIDRIILSTDDAAIAEAGRLAGLEVPFLRPPALARDDTPMLPVLQHAVAQLELAGWQPAFIALLQPTSPLRTAAHIRDVVTQLRESGADSVVTVVEVPKHLSPDYVMRIDHGVLRPFLPEGERITRRQDVRPAYSRDGTVYAFRRETLVSLGSIYGPDCRPVVIAPAESLSIDTPDDWAAAERILAVRGPAS